MGRIWSIGFWVHTYCISKSEAWAPRQAMKLHSHCWVCELRFTQSLEFSDLANENISAAAKFQFQIILEYLQTSYTKSGHSFLLFKLTRHPVFYLATLPSMGAMI